MKRYVVSSILLLAACFLMLHITGYYVGNTIFPWSKYKINSTSMSVKYVNIGKNNLQEREEYFIFAAPEAYFTWISPLSTDKFSNSVSISFSYPSMKPFSREYECHNLNKEIINKGNCRSIYVPIYNYKDQRREEVDDVFRGYDKIELSQNQYFFIYWRRELSASRSGSDNNINRGDYLIYIPKSNKDLIIRCLYLPAKPSVCNMSFSVDQYPFEVKAIFTSDIIDDWKNIMTFSQELVSSFLKKSASRYGD